ncbi:MAG: riboflavin synthase [Planctomycetes bacterium]|nr:riboflavin synthase [Planctomycetota bacterium]
MFTGIIEIVGRVCGSDEVTGGRRLTVDAGPVAEDLKPGASLAVNGVCLTATDVRATRVGFDVIAETLRRTNLGRLRVGDLVNLERSLRLGDRLDGHFVQGHIDGTGTIRRRTQSARECVVWVEPERSLMPCIIPKGSIAIDGISLTVAELQGGMFSVALIPTTLERTNLGDRRVGDPVNLETDMLIRAAVHHLAGPRAGDASTLTSLLDRGEL